MIVACAGLLGMTGYLEIVPTLRERTFQPTQGTIIAVDSAPWDKKGCRDGVRLDVRFAYDVGGTRHEGNRYGSAPRAGVFCHAAEGAARKAELEGARGVVVHYDPAQPQASVLVRHPFPALPLGICVAYAALLAVQLVLTWRARGTRRGETGETGGAV